MHVFIMYACVHTYVFMYEIFKLGLSGTGNCPSLGIVRGNSSGVNCPGELSRGGKCPSPGDCSRHSFLEYVAAPTPAQKFVLHEYHDRHNVCYVGLCMYLVYDISLTGLFPVKRFQITLCFRLPPGSLKPVSSYRGGNLGPVSNYPLRFNITL